MDTQIERTKTFVLNFASMLALQAALNEMPLAPKATKDELEKLILQAVEHYPQPAEA
tara:strand:+ start:1192 stop:1362 length:171 start_codon:yes stop_codon:yes gene_type:complete